MGIPFACGLKGRVQPDVEPGAWEDAYVGRKSPYHTGGRPCCRMVGGPDRARHRVWIIGDLIIGIIGAFIGGWLLPQLGIHLGVGLVAAIINATIGALILLLIITLVRGGGGWGARWSGIVSICEWPLMAAVPTRGLWHPFHHTPATLL
jgi:uncharacterized membrane protein YeaQ/YmgE (transglycosylase-associated protein family)